MREVTSASVGKALSKQRERVLSLGVVRTCEETRRIYAFCNLEKWRKAKPQQIARHWNETINIISSE